MLIWVYQLEKQVSTKLIQAVFMLLFSFCIFLLFLEIYNYLIMHLLVIQHKVFYGYGTLNPLISSVCDLLI